MVRKALEKEGCLGNGKGLPVEWREGMRGTIGKRKIMIRIMWYGSYNFFMEKKLPSFCRLMDDIVSQEVKCNLELVLSLAIHVFHETVNDDESKPLSIWARNNLISNKKVHLCEGNFPQFFDIQGEDIISLAPNIEKKTLLKQFAYQFLHEYCHRAIRVRWFMADDRRFYWLEETFCELSSIYFMKRMAEQQETWTFPFPPDYNTRLLEYAEDDVKKYRNDDSDVRLWLNEEKKSLEENGLDRMKNGFVMTRLLPLFEECPELWQAIPFMRRVPLEQAKGLRDFILLWRNVLPEGCLATPSMCRLADWLTIRENPWWNFWGRKS